MNRHNPARLPVSRKLGYGIGCIAYSLPYQITASALLFYMTAVLDIPVLWAGAIVAASALWDAMIDPLFGYLSDNTESRRFGRRHQYLLAGGVLICLFSYYLWSIDPNASSVFKIVLLCVLVFALKTALTIFVIPYNALGGELSTDYDERSSIQSYRALFYIIGMIVALVGSNVVFFRSTPTYPKGQLNPAAYPAMGLTFGIIALIIAVLCYFATRRYIPVLPQRSDAMKRKGLSWRHAYEDLRGALTNKDFRALTLMIFILEAGFQLGIVIGYHVNTYTYNLTAR